MDRTSRGAGSVLIIVQNLPVPFDRRVWQEATSLRGAGFDVAVICPKKGTYKESYIQLEGIDIYRYPLIVESDTSLLWYIAEFAYCWLATARLAIKAFRRRRFEVIHACNPPDTFFALALLFRPLGVRFVFDHHDLCPDLYIAKRKGQGDAGLVHRILLKLEHWTFRSADMVIAVNESHREIALKRGGLPKSKIVVVRSGPRRMWAEAVDLRPELKQGRKYLVTYLGEMGTQDGVDYLLRSVGHYREWYEDDTMFVLLGGGPAQAQMQRLAAELGLAGCVQFKGRVSEEELRAHLSTSDICVDPDPYTEFNNRSTMNKIIEFMSFGRPIVAFDLLEHRRSAGEAAIYIKPNDTEQFARGMRSLLEDERTRFEMSEYGKRRFRESLAWDVSESTLLEAYTSLLRREEHGRELLRQTG